MNHVVVVDYGSQFTRLLARAFRELHVFTEIVQPEDLQAALAKKPAGVVISRNPQDGTTTLLRSEEVAGWLGGGPQDALQLQAETAVTPEGMALLEQFVQASGASREWTPEKIVHELIRDVQEQVGDAQVLLAISGGVDSSTLGILLHRALGSRLHAVFVDHGLLRMGEAAEVEESLRSLGVNLRAVDASERFLAGLKGVADPEQKRKIIGHEFIDVFTEEARKLHAEHGDIRFLAQGTLYTDVIESASGADGVSVKSHHNVGGLPEELGFELLEPFRTLFKDEVRELAGLLGLPEKMRGRHPFPGPGLAIRVLGEVTPERLEIARKVDAIFVEALRESGLYDSTWQALAVLTPLRSVGVKDDRRTYSWTDA